ncbi:PH domain-containing protein [Plantactinospora sp. ZYX-F-223]|uniref:PH domain-containing protein n=1 Tax=Plantactinospora sp. ZYX-F-223 TaxID=3144103 RepID=UPI0031FD27E1
MHSEPDTPARRWRVETALPVCKLGGAALFVALGALFADGDPVRLGIGLLVGAVLLGWGVRDLVAPVRLAVDPDGVTVIQGFAGRRHIPWSEIERITVDTRPRLGLATETLEIDRGASLHLFSRYDLGVAPREVAEVLHAVRAGGPAGGGPAY